MGLTAALSNAARTLEVFSTGVQVAGNNIANADTPGFIREKLTIATAFPSRQGVLILGNGVIANGIRQQIDKHLEKRIYVANSDASGASTRNDIYKQLETYVNALGDDNLGKQLSGFVASLHNVANQPESAGNRQLAVQAAQTLVGSARALYTQLNSARTGVNDQIRDKINEANALIDQIAKLNPKIIGMESAGLLKSDATGLRSERYVALQRLSEIVPIRVVEQASGGVDVHLGHDSLIISGKVTHFRGSPSVDRGLAVTNVRLEQSTVDFTSTQGSLGGLLAGRDQIIGGYLDQVNAFARNVISQFNRQYSQGQGLVGFTSLVSDHAVTDPTAALNSSAANLSFPPDNGTFQVKLVNTSTGATATTTIHVNLTGVGSQTTLNSLAAQLSGVANLNASVTSDNRLSLSTATGFELRFQNDNSGVLASLGVNSFFTGTGLGDIDVSRTVVGNPNLFAAGTGGGPGDGSNAVLLAQFSNKPVTALNGLTISAFYNRANAALGQSSASEEALSSGSRTFLDALMNQRNQTTGVSLDEEAIAILKLQRGFQAVAKVISTIDQMYEALLRV
jgi:flagellar hook-associated protein 1 FlgK